MYSRKVKYLSHKVIHAISFWFDFDFLFTMKLPFKPMAELWPNYREFKLNYEEIHLIAILLYRSRPKA